MVRCVGVMGVVADPDEPSFDSDTAMEALIPIVTRVVRARVTDASLAEDLVQETLVRVLARANRVAPGMLEPYAIVTARNVVRVAVDRTRPAATQPASGPRGAVGRVAG